jgi:hypothetical protein
VYQVSFISDISFLRYCAETKKLTPGRPAAGTPGRPDNIHHPSLYLHIVAIKGKVTYVIDIVKLKTVVVDIDFAS